MMPYTFVSPKSQSCVCSLLIATSFICGVYFISSVGLGKDIYNFSPGVGTNEESVKCQLSTILNIKVNETQESAHKKKCNDKCRPAGSEALPRGIVSSTSNLEMIPLSGPIPEDKNSKRMKSLLGVPVGVKQKKLVNEIVKKFLELDFAVMLFHYDGVVDQWHDLEWSNKVVHISAINQTKWWFAKRFLHPDIVSEYEYIFLWDEDLGVENFHPKRYISIIKEEGLEISQPALDLGKSKVHHRITTRNRRTRVHRRFYQAGRCDGNSIAPPCVGWVEMMAPVFSRAAWRCVWHMIQNDLIHAWGLDMQLGYCSQGDRTVKVGVVDEQYIAHLALPTLGNNLDSNTTKAQSSGRLALSEKSSDSKPSGVNSSPNDSNDRSAIRLRSTAEMREFRNRWNNAVKEDECWIDPFRQRDTN